MHSKRKKITRLFFAGTICLALLFQFSSGTLAAPIDPKEEKIALSRGSFLERKTYQFLPALLSRQKLNSTGEVSRVSVGVNSAESNSQSNSPSISADGRYVAIASEADNLVDGDVNGMSDIFVYDLQAGTVVLASVDNNGIQGNGPSRKPSISADGRYVAFSSSATNLDDVQNGIVSIFVRDLYQGTTQLISGGIDNEPENCGSDDPSVSGNGRYVAFESCSSNLISDDTNDRYDVFVRDLATEDIRRVSWTWDGYERISDSKNPSISANGRYVGYHISYGWIDGIDYVYDMLTHTTVEIGRSSFEDRPVLSADGRYIVFSSHTDVGGVWGYSMANISIYDQNSGTSYAITNGSHSYDSFISLDGRYVTFSSSDQFVLEDTNYSKDIYRYDRVEGITTLVSIAADGTSGNHDSDGVSPISTDGRYIVFSSYASNLVDGDANGMEDVFLSDSNIVASSSVSGKVVDASNNGIAGVSVFDSAGHYAVTDSGGNYVLSGLPDGSYVITPSKNGFSFSPASSVETVPPDITGLNFIGTVETQNPNCITQTDIPQLECETLVALYNSTDGVHWTNHTNWLQTNTPCSWYGIHCAGGHVTEITLHGNNLSGSIPAQLGNLSYLTGLWLYDNHLTGTIPPELGNLVNLTELALYINQLSGSIPVELGNLTKLEWLNLSRNQLTGSIPSAFGDLTQLQGLYLFRNQLTGPIPAGLGNLVNLTELYLNENQLSGSIPPQLGNMGKLECLNLGVNQLSGPIPVQLGNLVNLTLFHLGSNQLSGPIPSELGNFVNLTHLYLDNNQLSGSIPTQLGNLASLLQMALANNQLSGPIPSGLGNLSNLRLLALDNNQLSGPIPSELGSLTSLQWLTLVDNRLNGEFPTSITNLANLTTLTFDCWITSSDPAVIAFIENLAPGWQNNTCPALISPQENAILDNGREDTQDNIVWDFDWSSLPNATKYNLYVYQSDAPIAVIDETELVDSSYHHVGIGNYILDANRLDWKWMVRAYINGAWGEWSEIRTFNVEPLDTDPPLQFANTFVGGTGNDAGNAIAVDADGNMYIAGVGNAAWGVPIQAHNGGMDAFVARLDSKGNLVWNTFLGGAGDDWGSSIAIDASGNVYLAGGSDAAWGSPLRAHAGDADAFVAKLDSSGHLVWNTFLGGSGYDEGFLTLDGSGNILVAGGSSSTWGAPLHAYNGYGDAFAARLNPSGGLVWNTFLGGAGGDEAWKLTTDGSNLYLTGYSDQTWGTPVRAYSGGFSDAFAAKLDASGAVLWNTFLGGAEHDEADGIAVAPNGNVYVSGFSDEGLGGTATWGNPVRPFSGERDAFAAGLAPSGALLWNTFLGGAGGDGSNNIAVGKDGSIFVVGGASGSWGNPMSAFAGTYDGFVARLSSSGILTGSTFLGGSNLDTANDIALDAKGRAFIAGYSASEWGKPITGYAGGGQDAFVAKVDLSTTFTDVPASYWAWSFIQRLANAGVTGGCSANPVMYCPDVPVNRAQMAVFLLRGKHGSAYSPPAASGTVFHDIPAAHWAAAWIEQLQAEGITSGCGNGNYCPDTAVTRDQMAVFLLRAKYGSSYAPPAASGNFIDVPTNYWAAAWIEQLAKEGITTGCGGGSYCPVAVTNRAQMAVFLVKAFGLP